MAWHAPAARAALVQGPVAQEQPVHRGASAVRADEGGSLRLRTVREPSGDHTVALFEADELAVGVHRGPIGQRAQQRRLELG